MATASISVDKKQFICPVCLDLLKNPVTVPCGHSYCMVCIKGCWDKPNQIGIYSCPQCRMTFTPRPILHKNTVLAEVVEKLKTTEQKAAVPDPGPVDVDCDFCIGTHKAIKSCLTCLASFCEVHLQPHHRILDLKQHKLINASALLDKRTCSSHKNTTDPKHNDEVAVKAKKTKKKRPPSVIVQLEHIQPSVFNSKPITRDDFLIYYSQLTLDPDTAHPNLTLSAGNRRVVNNRVNFLCPDHQDRFDCYTQVLCKESLCGRSYWEVEWTGSGVSISVSSKTIRRKGEGDECVFGGGNSSMSLLCLSTLSFSTNNKVTPIPGALCYRIGVYLDYSEGTLAFYSISDTMTLLHRVKTTFYLPQHAGFWISNESVLSLSSPVQNITLRPRPHVHGYF